MAVNDFLYGRLRREVDRLRDRGSPELLARIEDVARFAWGSHPGRLADGALENPLLDIGRTLADMPATAAEMAQGLPLGSRTLHVATQVYGTGGHTRVLAKWVQRDLSSSHAIIITRQYGALPEFLTLIAAERDAPIAMLDRSATILERARQLRAMSRGFDRVILHHHPDDAVPVIAYAVPGDCPVAMFNHAHFGFSLGSGVADMIVNTTPYFRQLTEDQRFPRATDVLHGPPGLERLRWNEVDKRQAKQRLGLSPDLPVAMTIGNEAYFIPAGGVDFFATLAKLLAIREELQVLVVGVPEGSALVPPSIRDTGRVRLVGPVSDPRPYYEAADICLESFPMPSLGALIEAPAYGQAFPFLAFAEAEGPLHVDLPQIAADAVRPRTESSYLKQVVSLVDAPETTFKRAGILRSNIIKDDEEFGTQFQSLYDRLSSLGHAPRKLPRTGCTANSANLALAALTSSCSIEKAAGIMPVNRKIHIYVDAVAAGHTTLRAVALVVARRLGRLVANSPGSIRRRFQNQEPLDRRIVDIKTNR